MHAGGAWLGCCCHSWGSLGSMCDDSGDPVAAAKEAQESRAARLPSTSSPARLGPEYHAGAFTRHLPDGYELECFASPAPDPTVFADDACRLITSTDDLGGASFLETWGKDLRLRAALPGSVFAVVRWEGECVAHTMIAYDPAARPSVGLVGHVFTAPAHRRKGLSTTVISAAMARHEQEGGRHWLLGTGNPAAAAGYSKLGFSHLNGGLEGETKGYNENDQGEWMMVRTSAETTGTHLSLYDAGLTPGTKYRCAALGREHWAAAVLLLNAFPHYSAPRGTELRVEGEAHEQAKPGIDKLPTSGLRDGLNAEDLFLRDILASDGGEASKFRVLLTGAPPSPRLPHCRAPRLCPLLSRFLCCFSAPLRWAAEMCAAGAADTGQLHGVAIGNEKYHCAPLLSNEGRG